MCGAEGPFEGRLDAGGVGNAASACRLLAGSLNGVGPQAFSYSIRASSDGSDTSMDSVISALGAGGSAPAEAVLREASRQGKGLSLQSDGRFINRDAGGLLGVGSNAGSEPCCRPSDDSGTSMISFAGIFEDGFLVVVVGVGDAVILPLAE